MEDFAVGGPAAPNRRTGGSFAAFDPIMNFQQLRYVRAAVHNDLNLTKVAAELFTSQSGVSKQIKELEIELRTEIFVRRGKRLVGLTQAGDIAVLVIDRLLQEAENLKQLSKQFVEADKGRLIVATTHNQANYVLPQVLLQFAREYPEVEVELRQGSPSYVVEALIKGDADLGIATEAIDGHPELQTHPCFTWGHVAIVPPGHPLTLLAAPTLADIAGYPVITYTSEYSGRSQVSEAFASAGLDPDIRLAAMDAEVIKTYARLGMGVGIVAQMAIENGFADGLVALPASNLSFGRSSTKIALHEGTMLRNYTCRLIAMIAPHLDARALSGSASPQDVRTFSERSDLQLERPGPPMPRHSAELADA